MGFFRGGGLMIYYHDWLMREIQMLTDTISLMVTGKTFKILMSEEIPPSEKWDHVYREMDALMNTGDVCEAENLLFFELDKESGEKTELMIIGMLFYAKLSEWSDHELAKSNFSKKEILEGLESLRKYIS